MRRLNIGEIGEQLDKWFRRAMPKHEADDPATPPEAAALAGDGLFAALLELEATEPDDGRTLVICQAQDAGKGEDSCLAVRNGKRVFLGAFDGCGGSGAKVYSSFGGHTGAWAASRAATLAARDWFLRDDGGDLADAIDRALQDCKARQPAGQLLMGSLSREFPTTVAAFAMSVDGGEAAFYWCGDSRCYALDADGLHQITADDAAIRDAMRNLREDAPMTNVACASRPFVLHQAEVKLEKPALIFAATDGCFGYLPSPMAFERLLLKSMRRASNLRDWKRALDGAIRAVSGDDYTLTAWIHGFGDFKRMKKALAGRLAALERDYPVEAGEEALFAQWERYRPGYERLLQITDSERDET